jgi:hypothetical protein
VPPADRVPFAIFTEDEIRARFGSLIRNGHGHAAQLAAPAAPVVPEVLARTAIRITAAVAPPWVDTFSDDDQPVLIGTDDHPRSQQGKIFQNQRWSFYSYGAGASQSFIERGKLHTVLADWEQAIFSTNIAYPRRTVALDDERYLHVRFDVSSNATQRRYWWLVLCGAAAAGATMDERGLLKGQIVQTPFFYQPDGRNPSVLGWNCLQVFPRDGWPFDLGPTDTRPESDLRVMVNVAGAGDRDSVVNVSPDQYENASIAPPSWYRQQENGRLGAPIADDAMVIAPRTKVELFIRRDRVILSIDGEQRLCNDFPTAKLTMAEGALGFGQVLYHSTAERVEFSRDYWMRTGQRYYLENTPYVDERTWDNMGFEERVAAPEGFDAGRCYVAP